MSKPELPDTLYLGMKTGEWPIYSFTIAAHAITWLKEHDSEGRTRRLWEVKLGRKIEMRVVDPRPYLAPIDHKRGKYCPRCTGMHDESDHGDTMDPLPQEEPDTGLSEEAKTRIRRESTLRNLGTGS